MTIALPRTLIHPATVGRAQGTPCQKNMTHFGRSRLRFTLQEVPLETLQDRPYAPHPDELQDSPFFSRWNQTRVRCGSATSEPIVELAPFPAREVLLFRATRTEPQPFNPSQEDSSIQVVSLCQGIPIHKFTRWQGFLSSNWHMPRDTVPEPV